MDLQCSECKLGLLCGCLASSIERATSVSAGGWKLVTWTAEHCSLLARSFLAFSGNWVTMHPLTGVCCLAQRIGKGELKSNSCVENPSLKFKVARASLCEVWLFSISPSGVHICDATERCILTGVWNEPIDVNERLGCGTGCCKLVLRWGVKMSAQHGCFLTEENWELGSSFRAGVNSGVALRDWGSSAITLSGRCFVARLAIGSFSSKEEKIKNDLGRHFSKQYNLKKRSRGNPVCYL